MEILNRAQKLLTKAAGRLDLPADIAAGVPHIALNGFGECTLDCHRGILAYEENEIVIQVNIGTVTVRGSGLQVKLMHRDRLTVTGQIESLAFAGGA